MTTLPLLLAFFALATPAPGPLAASAPTTAVTPDHAPTRDAEAGLDQAWLAPTAFTQPAMSVTLHDHELAIVGATFAPLDRWQITLAGVPVPTGPIFVASTKVRFVDLGRFHLAALGGYGRFVEEETAWFGGAAASVCLRADCAGLISAYGLVAADHKSFTDNTPPTPTTAVAFGVSAIVPITSYLKLVGEVDAGGHDSCAWNCDPNDFETILVFAGARLHVDKFAVTLGAVADVESTIVHDPGSISAATSSHHDFTFHGVLPAGSLAYRFGGP